MKEMIISHVRVHMLHLFSKIGTLCGVEIITCRRDYSVFLLS